MNKLDELRKQLLELEEKSCVLLRVRGKDVSIVLHTNLDKGHRSKGHHSKREWIPAIPLIGYVEAK